MSQKQPPSLNLKELESFICDGNYIACEKMISSFINMQLQARINFVNEDRAKSLNSSQQDVMAYQTIERLTCLLSTFLSKKDYTPSIEFFIAFVVNKKFVTNLFAASSYGNTEHIVNALNLVGRRNFSADEIRKLLMLVTPETSFELPWLQLFNFMPIEAFRAYIGLMYCAESNITQQSSQKLNDIAGLSKDIPTLTFKQPQALSSLINAYFNISTLTGTGKYDFKKWVVKNICNFMDDFLSDKTKRRIANVPDKITATGKQKVIVFHERYTGTHAMYRCYHSLIAPLMSEYHVIGFGFKNNIDENSKLDHHEFYEIEDEFEIEKTVNAVLDVEASLIIYPSVGMSNIATICATQKLAPVQAVLPGHPSSSYMEAIDYMVLEDLGISQRNLESILTEKPIVMKAEHIKVVPIDFEIETQVNNEDECHIAVNGVMTKVTDSLIDVCQKITDASKNKVVFHFFMNSPMLDIEYYSAKSVLMRVLPNSVVHAFGSYNTYMNNLVQCDFAIPTLPFGGANSNIDLVRLNIPKLFILDETDLSTATDYYMWAELNDLSGLCSSKSELITRAVAMANDKAVLEEAKSSVAKIDIENYFTTDEVRIDDRLFKSVASMIKLHSS